MNVQFIQYRTLFTSPKFMTQVSHPYIRLKPCLVKAVKSLFQWIMISITHRCIFSKKGDINLAVAAWPDILGCVNHLPLLFVSSNGSMEKFSSSAWCVILRAFEKDLKQLLKKVWLDLNRFMYRLILLLIKTKGDHCGKSWKRYFC